MQPAMQPAQDSSLPELRKDLRIFSAGSFSDGAPSWIVHDGLRNRYFRVGESTRKLLSIWRPISLDAFADEASVKLKKPVSVAEVEGLAKFLFSNNLTVSGPQDNYASFFNQHKATQRSWFGVALHNYLFFKIPLVRPQRFIEAAWPLVSPFFTRKFAFALLAVALFSLFLVSRQWQTFTATFYSFLTFEGLLLYLSSLVFLKICHEFGHAFMARKFDVEVPTIGVAFLLLFPVLYTDTSAAAKLKNKRSKLLIDCGGMMVELTLAVLATFLWVFLPDGPLRAIAFTTATLSWVLSLTINLNPLMRFDGYFVLSDLLGVENLQHRGFEMAKWQLRELLFRPGRLPPERTSSQMRRLMICYAWATWIYRFFLFLGIALIVYHFFIKVVGIVLFAVEIVWFILLPVWREIAVWWQERETFATPRFGITVLCLASLLVLSALPVSTAVRVATIAKANNQIRLFPARPGKVMQLSLQPGELISEGQVLAVLDSPDLTSEIQLSTLRLELLQTRLRRVTTNEFDLSSISVLRQEHAAEKARLDGLLKEREQLSIRAPFDGYLENIDPELHVGQWVGVTQPLALFRSALGLRFIGLVSADDVTRIGEGTEGVFIPDGTLTTREPVRLASVSSVAEHKLEHDMLADIEGGIVPTMQQPDGTLEVQGSWFRVEMQYPNGSDHARSLSAVRRGVTTLKGEPQSWLSASLRQITYVLIRESGF